MQTFQNDEYNYFSRVSMSEEEQKAGSTFNSLQIDFIQNYISRLAVSCLSVATDLDTPLKSEIQRAYLRGQMDALKSLIDINPEGEI